jgi:predicted Zn-dependent protease
MRTVMAAGLALLVCCGGWSPTSQAQDKPVPGQAANPDALPEKAEARFQEARRLVAGKKFDEAEKELDQVLKAHGGHEPSLMKLAEVYEKTGREQEAFKLLRQRLEEPGATSQVALFLASMLEHRKKRSEARQVLEDAGRRWTSEAGVFVRLGQFYGFADMARAEVNYKKALALDPDQRTALNNLASVMSAQARFQEAHKLLEHNIEVNPKSIAGAFNLASACYATGKLEQGKALHKDLLERRPNDPFAISGLALGHTLSGDYDKADQVLAEHLKEGAALVRYAQGVNLLFRGKPAEAEPVLAGAWKDMTGRLHIGVAYAEALRQNKKLAQAQALLQRMEGARNAAPLVRPYQALLLYSQGDLAKAHQARVEAIKLLPDYAAPADLKVLARMPDTAIEAFTSIASARVSPEASPDAGQAPPAGKPKGSSCGCVTPTVPVSPAPWGLLLLAGLWVARLRR